ncbi:MULTISPECIES: hypothetical protein [Nocardiopsis]|uniref:Spore-associated protein A n=1 Tax=Nocardiopsis sinuspersici TaxID=501010 RepID=A0A1V3C0C5_9ACTN|nr:MULTISPECIES: hypothetical protein [Nocardiopsis]OOC54092.1 hypothetical protein NOSIN_09970 [Nocardiopsis sinuspersici]
MARFTRTIKNAAVAMAIASAALLLSPAAASAHTLGDAARSSGGCGWASGSYTTLDSRPIRRWSGSGWNGAQTGTVYLLWSNTYQENCVVTLKSHAHGTSTLTTAILYLYNPPEGDAYTDRGNYGHYAAVSRSAAGRCVRFHGSIDTTDGSTSQGTRTTWGNCG